MADLSVQAFGLQNPIVIASSPATQGVKAVLKSARSLPGAIAMRNFGHGAGGGSYAGEGHKPGKLTMQIHAFGARIDDDFANLEAYCEGVKKARQLLPEEVKLWVSVGHFSDLVRPFAWEEDWKRQARELTLAGADALELHFNTPGVVAARDRVYDYYRLVYRATKMVKDETRLPVMVKLPVENCDTLRAIDAAVYGGAAAAGPTARWKGLVFDLDWKQTLAEAGGGYGGAQALPVICQVVAEARNNGITLPLYAGGGVFSWQDAAKLIMAGSDMVQLGSLACCEGPAAVKRVIDGLNAFMDKTGYADLAALRGAVLPLTHLTPQQHQERTEKIGAIYREAPVDQGKCIGCGRCEEACWYEGIAMQDGKAQKTPGCIGCGYCFSACPTGALSAAVKQVAADALETL